MKRGYRDVETSDSPPQPTQDSCLIYNEITRSRKAVDLFKTVEANLPTRSEPLDDEPENSVSNKEFDDMCLTLSNINLDTENIVSLPNSTDLVIIAISTQRSIAWKSEVKRAGLSLLFAIHALGRTAGNQRTIKIIDRRLVYEARCLDSLMIFMFEIKDCKDQILSKVCSGLFDLLKIAERKGKNTFVEKIVREKHLFELLFKTHDYLRGNQSGEWAAQAKIMLNLIVSRWFLIQSIEYELKLMGYSSLLCGLKDLKL